MSLLKKVMACLLPVAAAGMMYCGGVKAENIQSAESPRHKVVKKENDLEFRIGLSIMGNIGPTELDRIPKPVEDEAANPYLVFNGHRIDATTTPSLSAYTSPSLEFPGFGIGLNLGVKYKGLFVHPKLMLGGGRSTYLECQAPQPHVPMSYYDIRYCIITDTEIFPLTFNIGHETKIWNFVSSISYGYLNITNFKVMQGIESYNTYKDSRVIASGQGGIHSFELGLSYLVSADDLQEKKRKWVLGAEPKFEIGLNLKYQLGHIDFDSGERARFSMFLLSVELGFRF